MKDIAANLRAFCSLFTILLWIHVGLFVWSAVIVGRENAEAGLFLFLIGLAATFDFLFILFIGKCVAAIGEHLASLPPPTTAPDVRYETRRDPLVADEIPDDWLATDKALIPNPPARRP